MLTSRRLTAAALRPLRRFASGGPVDTSTLYGRMMASNPLRTSALTGSVLWSSGDLVAQFLEGAESHERTGGSHATKDEIGADSRKAGILGTHIDCYRTAGTVVHGTLIGGAGTYLWFNFLDYVVRGALRLTPGGLPFVGAKLGLEIAIWHPTSLLAYWTICGTAQGHSLDMILRELRGTFVSTLVGGSMLWVPMDILCFWKIPVGLQTLFANAGSFVESIALSYIHGHGLDLFALLSSSLAMPLSPPTPETQYSIRGFLLIFR